MLHSHRPTPPAAGCDLLNSMTDRRNGVITAGRAVRAMSSLLQLVIVLAIVCRHTAAQGGCIPSPPSSLITGTDKTGVIPTLRAPPGGTVRIQ